MIQWLINLRRPTRGWRWPRSGSCPTRRRASSRSSTSFAGYMMRDLSARPLRARRQHQDARRGQGRGLRPRRPAGASAARHLRRAADLPGLCPLLRARARTCRTTSATSASPAWRSSSWAFPGPKLMPRRAAHPGPDRRLHARPSSRPTRARTRKLQIWSFRDLPIFYFLNPLDPHLLDFLMQGLWNETQYNPLATRYWSCVPYLLGEGQAMMYSFRPKIGRDHRHPGRAVRPRAAELPARQHDRHPRPAGRRARPAGPGPDRPASDADRERRRSAGPSGCRRSSRSRRCTSRGRSSTPRPMSSSPSACR